MVSLTGRYATKCTACGYVAPTSTKLGAHVRETHQKEWDTRMPDGSYKPLVKRKKK